MNGLLSVHGGHAIIDAIGQGSGVVSRLRELGAETGRQHDFPALVAAVNAGKVPIQALLPNQAFLDNQARALGPGFAFPGVSVHTEKLVAASAR